jgi:hypothetical protein
MPCNLKNYNKSGESGPEFSDVGQVLPGGETENGFPTLLIAAVGLAAITILS